MSTAAEEIRVRSVADLVPLLEHADPEIRTAAYASVLADPRKALALAPDDCRDIVDVLIGMLGRQLPRREKVPLLAMLGQFHDPRVETVFVNILRLEDSDELLHVAARYVNDTGLVVAEPELLRLLRSNDNMSKVRIAAELLVERRGLAPADQIRVAAFTAGTAAFPPMDADTADAWVGQLQSPLRDYFCLVLEKRGPGLEHYRILWPELDISLQSWLVRCACHCSPVVESIVKLGMQSEFVAVRSATLTAIRLYRPELGD